MLRRRAIIGQRLLVVTSCLMVFVATSASGQAPSTTPRRITVFAAASLAEAFTEMGRRFEARTDGASVTLNLAGSQQLAAQIEHGATADVFASADRHWMEQIERRGDVAAPVRDFARNRLTVIVSQKARQPIEQLQDLARPAVQVVLGAEAVPIGHYSREVLRKLSAAPAYGERFAEQVLRNTVSYEDTVKGVVSKVQLGEADAGIVYVSDVTASVAAAVRVIEIPDFYNVVAVYPIAVLRRATDPERARAFIAFVLAREGQEILRAHRFMPIDLP